MNIKSIYLFNIILILFLSTALGTDSFSSLPPGSSPGSSASTIEYDGWLQIQLFHSIESQYSDKFVNRGNVTVSNLNAGTFDIHQENLSSNDRIKIKQIADENGFYRLKMIVTNSNGERQTFLTSSKACALINSQLNDILWISLDHTGSVLGITQTIAGGVLGLAGIESPASDGYRLAEYNCKNIPMKKLDYLDEFNTDVVVKHSVIGPIPDTASFIQKIEKEREARDRGEVKDNRSFIAKYWMYIVPVVLLVLITGAANPDAGAAAR